MQPDNPITLLLIRKKSPSAYGERIAVMRKSFLLQSISTASRYPPKQDDYYVILARLVAYKRIDLAVEAFTSMNKRLVIIGAGPALADLKSVAGPTVEFAGRANDAEVEDYVAKCRALIFPGEEDFGMAPLEVAAAGRPTIAYRAGGALETVVEGETGVFFNEQTPRSLIDAVYEFERQSWSPEILRDHARHFGKEAFAEKMLTFLRRIGTPVDGPAASRDR